MSVTGEGEEFHTVRGYAMLSHRRQALTAAMEDYLEMICRLVRREGHARVSTLAAALNVQPPSVTRMLGVLHARGLVEYEPYGLVRLTEVGRATGEYFMRRHDIVREFLQLLGVRRRILENVELIEHNLTQEAVCCLRRLLEFLHSRSGLLDEFASFRTGARNKDECLLNDKGGEDG